MPCNTKIISTHLAKSERIPNLNILPMELIGISQQILVLKTQQAVNFIQEREGHKFASS